MPVEVGPGSLPWSSLVFVRVMAKRTSHLRAVGFDEAVHVRELSGFVFFNNAEALGTVAFVATAVQGMVEEKKKTDRNFAPLRDPAIPKQSALQLLRDMGVELGADGPSRLVYVDRCICGSEMPFWKYLYLLDISESERDNIRFDRKIGMRRGSPVFVPRDSFVVLMGARKISDGYRINLAKRQLLAA